MSGSAALVSIVAPQAGHVCVAISLPAIVSIVTYRLDCHIDRVRSNRMALAVKAFPTSDTAISSVGLGVSSRLPTQLRRGINPLALWYVFGVRCVSEARAP